MKIEKVTLIGLGAMGVFFAPRLQAGLKTGNFRVMAEGERKKRLESQGVTLNGVNYRFPIVEPSETGNPADLIIMAVKDMGLDQAIRDYNQGSRYPLSIARGVSYLRDGDRGVKRMSDWKYEADQAMYRHKKQQRARAAQPAETAAAEGRG